MDAAQYFRDRLEFTMGPLDLHTAIMRGDNVVIVDVRDTKDFGHGHIHGSVSLPRDLWDTARGLRLDATNVLLCNGLSLRAVEAALFFTERGYKVKVLEGGYTAWHDANLAFDDDEWDEAIAKAKHGSGATRDP